MSSLLVVTKEYLGVPDTIWAGRYVKHTEIPYFYGQSVLPPYPHFIAEDGREITQLDILA